MPQNKIPFARKIPLVVTTGLLATPLSPLWAADVNNTAWQWKCSADSGKWACTKEPKRAGALPAAPLPTAPPQAPSRGQMAASPETTVATTSKIEEGASVTAAVKSDSEAKPAPATKPVPEIHEAIRRLDWVSVLPKELQSRNPYCKGGYLEPDRPGKHFKGKPKDTQIHAEADNTTYQGEGGDKGIAELNGNVVIRQGYRQLESDSTVFDRESQITTMEGNVVIREPGILMTGSSGEIYMDSGRARLDNAQYVVHESHARGSANTIERGEDEVIDLENAEYTTCPPGRTTWAIGGSQVSLDPTTGFGSAKHAIVKAGGYPVFYFPYLYFPIDDRRHSGFLYPSFSSSSKRGLDLKTPYYLNLAPNYDATITPRYMSKRGLLTELEGRYLTKEMEGEVGGGYLDRDSKKKENINYDDDRWLINWRHKQNFTDRWKADVDYANASDKEYLSDFGTSLNASAKDVLNQNVSTTYLGGDDWHQWQAMAAVEKHKNMSNKDDPYDKDHQFEFKGKLFADTGINLDYLVDHTQFTRDKEWQYQGNLRESEKSAYDKQNEITRAIYGEGTSINHAIGDRRYLESAVSYPMVSTWGYVKPKLKVRHVSYSLDRLNREQLNTSGLKYDTSPGTTAPTASLDSGLFMDRSVSLFGDTFTHTFEPRAMYVLTPYRDDQEQNPVFDTSESAFSYASLWREDRFTGYDRIGDTNHLALGATTRLIEDDGFERGHFGFGQIYYFADRKAMIDPALANEGKRDPNYITDEAKQRLLDQNKNGSSPFATELVWNFNRNLSLKQDWIHDFEEDRNTEYGITLSWMPDNLRAINVGYRYRNEIDRTVKDNDGNVIPDGSPKGYKTANGDFEQTDISVIWPLAYNWGTLARWQYDLTNNRHIERLFGFEYNNCCYQVRVGWRSWVDPADDIDNAKQDRGVFLQLVLRGLGNITDGKVEGWLQDIQGYKKREN